MKNDTLKAQQLLHNKGYTCVLCKGNIIYTSEKRGIMPLVTWIENSVNLKGFCAADKVVGKAAAFLYVILGVSQVYADIMSEAAIYTLAHYGIQPFCNTTVKVIFHRTNTDICPMESSVKDIASPKSALAAIKQKLRMLQLKQS